MSLLLPDYWRRKNEILQLFACGSRFADYEKWKVIIMKLVELAVTMNEDGTVAIPIETMEQMKIHLGDTLNLIYMAENEDNLANETKEFLLAKEGKYFAGEIDKEVTIQVPMELLQDAGIPLDSDLEIVCADKKIVIFPLEESEMIVPKELHGIFEEMGISLDKAKIIMRTEGAAEDGKTNL